MKQFLKKSFCALLLACTSLSAENNFVVTNLVSNQPGVAPHTDPNLVNAWGLTFDRNGNLVVSDTEVSLATSYAPDGTILNFVISVPEEPTGVVCNPSDHAFIIEDNHAATFIFVTEEGEILAFNKDVDATSAVQVAE